MTKKPNAPGWYPDPYRRGPYRYYDGKNWSSGTSPAPEHLTPAQIAADPNAPAPIPVVEGPNHALHFILTLLTVWAFGGWLWVWLFIALNNKRRVRYIRP